MLTPGPQMSGLTRPSAVGPRPELKSSAKPSFPTPVSDMLPTVIALRAAPGLPIVYVCGPRLAAATHTTSPAADARSTARDAASVPSDERSSPLLTLTTLIPNLSLFSTHQSSAAAICERRGAPTP